MDINKQQIRDKIDDILTILALSDSLKDTYTLDGGRAMDNIGRRLEGKEPLPEIRYYYTAEELKENELNRQEMLNKACKLAKEVSKHYMSESTLDVEKPKEITIDTDKINKVEYIGSTREFVKHLPKDKKISISIQDSGKTLKIFEETDNEEDY